MKILAKQIFTGIVLIVVFLPSGFSQIPEEIMGKVKSKLDRVNDYEATGKMKTNVVFIKAPVATVRIYYKKPNRVKIKNETGISFIPKGSVNINLNNLFANIADYDLLDGGIEKETGLRIIKMLPKNDNADVVLSVLYIDEKKFLIKKARTTTRDSGTYELEMTYGKYMDYGLADKVVFSFNTKEYKLPKGITFDYDDGSRNKQDKNKMGNKKGKIEIIYSSYSINKGFPDSIFE